MSCSLTAAASYSIAAWKNSSRVALYGIDGASRTARRSTGAQADPRAPGVRPQHLAVRSYRTPANRRAWRRANAKHRRLVCCRAQQSKRRGPRRDSMSTPSNTMPGSPLESQVTAPAVITASRRMYWSVRRELWEHRSIFIAPLAAAAVFLLAFLTGLTISPVHRHSGLDTPYALAAALILG